MQKSTVSTKQNQEDINKLKQELQQFITKQIEEKTLSLKNEVKQLKEQIQEQEKVIQELYAENPKTQNSSQISNGSNQSSLSKVIRKKIFNEKDKGTTPIAKTTKPKTTDTTKTIKSKDDMEKAKVNINGVENLQKEMKNQEEKKRQIINNINSLIIKSCQDILVKEIKKQLENEVLSVKEIMSSKIDTLFNQKLASEKETFEFLVTSSQNRQILNRIVEKVNESVHNQIEEIENNKLQFLQIMRQQQIDYKLELNQKLEKNRRDLVKQINENSLNKSQISIISNDSGTNAIMKQEEFIQILRNEINYDYVENIINKQFQESICDSFNFQQALKSYIPTSKKVASFIDQIALVKKQIFQSQDIPMEEIQNIKIQFNSLWGTIQMLQANLESQDYSKIAEQQKKQNKKYLPFFK